MQVSPYIKRGVRQQPANPLEVALGIQETLKKLNDKIEEVSKLKDDLKKEHENSLAQMKKEHDAEMFRIRGLQRVNKGEKGDPGHSVDENLIVNRVISKIPIPKDGKDGETPIVDHFKIAKLAKDLIPDPEIKHEIIAEKVLNILEKGKRKLSIKHIGDFNTGLEQTIAPIRNLAAGFRGGGDTVAAGSNITISTSGGVKTISSSSGGLTALTATEVPNGSRTTFTFAGASAQPSYLVVDNVWMKATTKAGTVNWTWNNGTKVATLTLPPNDDIWGVV